MKFAWKVTMAALCILLLSTGGFSPLIRSFTALRAVMKMTGISNEPDRRRLQL